MTIRTILADRPVTIVMLITFVIMLGFGIIAPILPLFARSFGVGYSDAGLLISAFAFTRLVFDLFAGPLVDRHGERLSATAGLVVVAISSVLTGLAPTFVLAVVSRAAGGAGSSLLFAAMYSYLLKVVPKHRMARTLGIFYGSFNVGFIAGGPIGGLIARVGGLASPLFFYAGLCILSAVLYLRLVSNPEGPAAGGREPQDESQEGEPLAPAARSTRRVLADLFASRAFVTTVVLNLAFFWVIAGGYDTLVPLFGQGALHLSTVGIGLALAVAVGVEFLVLYPSGAVADRFGRKALLIPATAWFAAVIAAVGWARGFGAFLVLMALLGVGSGTSGVAPAAMLSDVVPDQESGTAVGVFRFFGDLGFVFGPLAAGFTTTALGFRAAFGLMAVPLLVALVLVLRTPETLSRGERSASDAVGRVALGERPGAG